ncbi:PqqD family protein [Allocoleopsis sp.]|uniref:PqqD family protein n=1 Tax=Allocoleopsis sp. TaxID=3088169 RepID=UPI002FCF619A
MRPIARKQNLLIQEVDNELMVYDQKRDVCHCLNPVAAKVWNYCDGYNTVEDIAKFLEQELEVSADTDIRGLVWVALEELGNFHLIKEYRREEIVSTPTISRRKAVKQATLVGGFALGALFPMVSSIAAPAAAQAASKAKPPSKEDSDKDKSKTSKENSNKNKNKK